MSDLAAMKLFHEMMQTPAGRAKILDAREAFNLRGPVGKMIRAWDAMNEQEKQQTLSKYPERARMIKKLAEKRAEILKQINLPKS